MVIGKYKAQIIHALWQRITDRGGLHGCFWYPTDGWIEGEEMINYFKQNGFEL